MTGRRPAPADPPDPPPDAGPPEPVWASSCPRFPHGDLGELRDPRDIADPDDWGPLG